MRHPAIEPKSLLENPSGDVTQRSDQGTETSILCFGEVLLRLTPRQHSPGGAGWFDKRSKVTAPAGVFEAWWGGSEANVAVGLAQLGSRATLLTTTPDQELGAAARAALIERGVTLSPSPSQGHRLKNRQGPTGGRMGIYFAATQPTGKTMIYDRTDSAFALSPPSVEHVDWNNHGHFHTSGINPALSQACADATKELLATAKRHGLATSFDLNLRQLLWSDQEAGHAIAPLLPKVDLLLAHAGQLSSAFKLDRIDLDDPDHAALVLSEFCKRHSVKTVIVTGRDTQEPSETIGANLSATEAADPDSGPGPGPHKLAVPTRLRALRATADSMHSEQTPWFTATDRIGSGDAFSAGLLAAQDQGKTQLHWALSAASLANQCAGDFPSFDREALASRSHEFFGSPR